MKLFQESMLLFCVLSASMVLVACTEECFETDAGGVCVDTYDDGYYYDSLVSGVTYESRNEDGDVMRTAVTGEGNDPGRFRFLPGQTIAFSLGDTDLGESDAKAQLTPFDLAGVEEAAVGGCEVDGTLPPDDDPFQIVHNLAVLLQTMDTDGDPTAGIEISSEVADLFDGVTIDLDKSWDEFSTDTELLELLNEANEKNLFPEERALREREDALRALYKGIPGLCES